MDLKKAFVKALSTNEIHELTSDCDTQRKSYFGLANRITHH